MIERHNEIIIEGIDTRQLSNFIIELNIARRNSLSYPVGHPLIKSSSQKVIDLYQVMLDSNGEIRIGVARDTLMLGTTALDKKNLVYRDFAGVLFRLGIGGIVLGPGLSGAELEALLGILNTKRQEIDRLGGIAQAWEQAGITSVTVLPVQYDMFTAVDGTSQGEVHSEGLWERFVRGLLQNGFSDTGSSEDGFDPDVVAAILNHSQERGDHHIGDYSQSIIEFMRQGDELQARSGLRDPAMQQKMTSLVSKLNPTLRRQFLASSFDSGNTKSAEELVSKLPTSVVIDTLEDLNRNRISLNPIVMDLLERMSEHSASRGYGNARGEADEKTEDRMQNILQEHASEELIPGDYQAMITSLSGRDTASLSPTFDPTELLQTLEPSRIEASISDIALALLTADPFDAANSDLLSNLKEMCVWFLQTGDYDRIIKIMTRLKEVSLPKDMHDALWQQFSEREFLEEILTGLHVWGKPRYADIGTILKLVGPVCIDAILDHLAEEASMSLRRFLIDNILHFGIQARDPVLRRMHDTRWYFLRNLLSMLRSIGDPSVVPSVKPMTSYPHHRVQQEAQSTLLHFNDRPTIFAVVRDIEQETHEKCLHAVHLAGKCSAREMTAPLLALVNRKGFSAAETDLKVAAVHALAERANEAVLPELSRLFEISSVFHAAQVSRLKHELILSLIHYPHQAVTPILEKVAAGSGETATQAAAVLKRIQSRIR